MKSLNWIVFAFGAIVLCGFAHSQIPNKGERRTSAQVVEFLVSFQQQKVMDLAEAMPAEKYGFAPTQGEFKGALSFGRQLVHVAADNYILGSAILGEKPPVDVGVGESGSESVKTKPEILAYLNGSFDYMRRAAAAVDDNNALMPTPPISIWPKEGATRLGIAMEDCAHTWNHYGQLIEYLRMNEIIPPESRKPPANQK